jgi:hypothetical protein
VFVLVHFVDISLKGFFLHHFYSFILSLVAFGLKLNGGCILLRAKALGWAGLYTPPIGLHEVVVLCFV